MHRNRNPCNSSLMVKMARGMDHGRVGPTTTTTSDDDVAQHGGHPANTKSCSLGLHYIVLDFSIITQMTVEILALSLAENVSYSAIITSDKVIVTGGQILKMAVTHFVDVSEEKMVSQQILTTVITRSVVDKSTDHAKPHLICLFFTAISKITTKIFVNVFSELKTPTLT